jgi:hypothetical protein
MIGGCGQAGSLSEQVVGLTIVKRAEADAG